MAIQPDGKIVVGGAAAPDYGFVARLNPDGSLDPTFGRGGVVVDRRISAVTTLALQADGKVVVASRRGMARYHADGWPDASFGEGGISEPHGGNDAFSIVPMANGLIAVARTHRGTKLSPPMVSVDLLAPWGEVAWPFVLLGPSPSAFGSDMIQLADGSFLLAGSEIGNAGFHPLLARLVLGSGRPDPSFGEGEGLDAHRLRGVTFAAAAEHDETLYALGEAEEGIGLMRFTEDGKTDPEFGSDGLAEAGPGGAVDLNGTDLAVQADGKVVVSAEGGICPACSRAWIARFTRTGEVDTSFDSDGFAQVADASGNPLSSHGKNVALLPGGRSLIVGTGPEHGVVLAAFDADGEPDRSFGNAGVTTIVPSCPGDEAAQRRSGCLPSARARLRVRHLRGKRAFLNLRVWPAQPWSRIASVRLLLPPALRIRRRGFGKIRSMAFVGDRDKRAGMELGRRGVKVFTEAARSVRLTIPRGALRRVRPVGGGRKLPYRLWVEFGRGEGTQGLVLRRAG